VLSLTYNTDRIEGSTLSLAETAAILFNDISLPNKSLVEQLEAKNHQAALEYLFRYLTTSRKIDEALILKLHGMLMNGILGDAGMYRRHAVRIVGANVPTANYLKVPVLVKKLIEKIARNPKDSIAHMVRVHAEFEKIHPFSDGNGRIGRLAMNAMALRKNIAPPMILQENRRFYFTYLQKAQQTGDTTLLEDFICDAISGSYKILERK